jgi:hypothetical protein
MDNFMFVTKASASPSPPYITVRNATIGSDQTLDWQLSTEIWYHMAFRLEFMQFFNPRDLLFLPFFLQTTSLFGRL